METKKSPKVNLEKKRVFFLEIGFIFAMGICLVAFEWSNEEITENVYENSTIDLTIESEIVNTYVAPPPPPPPIVIPETITINPNNSKSDTASSSFNEGYTIIPREKTKVDIIEIPTEEEVVFNIGLVDKKPIFPGGEAALLKFIGDNTKYPAIPKENGIQGKVYIQFVIGRDGKVGNLTIIKSIDKYLDQEALRVISILPDWTPGVKGGKLVPVSFIIPINFTLKY